MAGPTSPRRRRRPRPVPVGRLGGDDPHDVVCRHCGRRFRAIRALHLRFRHDYEGDHPVHDYERRFGLEYASSSETRRKNRSHSTRHNRERHPPETWTARRLRREIRARQASGADLRRPPSAGWAAAARRLHGSWSEALAAVRSSPRPSIDGGEALIARIRCLAKGGQPIEAVFAVERWPDLFAAVTRRFGAWKPALRRAGVNPVHHQLRREAPTLDEAAAWVRRRHARGHSVEASRAPGRLYAAVVHRTRRPWSEFVGGLGLPYPRPPRRRDWDRATVLREIRARYAKGQPLNRGALAKESQALIHQARNHFKTWDGALRAAGLDPKAIRRRRPWTRADVRAAIRARASQGLALDATSVQQQDRRLFRAGVEQFDGGWRRALAGSGLDPSQHTRLGNRRWTLESAATWVRAEATAGRSILSSFAPAQAVKLVRQSVAGGWRAFVESLGVPYPAPARRRWSRALVLDEIRRHQRAGKPLTSGAAYREDAVLWMQAREHFGRWVAAARAAGVPEDRLWARRRWTRKEVIEGIQRRSDAGERLDSGAVKAGDHALWLGGMRCFDDSWARALHAAGVDARAHDRRHGPWTRATLAAWVRARHAAGESVATSRVPASVSSWVHHHLDMAWSEFVRSLGVPYADPRTGIVWSAGAVRRELRRLSTGRAPLRARPVSRAHHALYVQALRHFGSWRDALRAAGLPALTDERGDGRRGRRR